MGIAYFSYFALVSMSLREGRENVVNILTFHDYYRCHQTLTDDKSDPGFFIGEVWYFDVLQNS